MNDAPSHAGSETAVSALLLGSLAMVAFAANSVLCRLALGADRIDAASFASVRVLSGALVLGVFAAIRGDARPLLRSSWQSAGFLFLYAVPFAFAYQSLSTGTGALILFGSVQATMLIAALVLGERPDPRQWLGLVLALGGLGYLVFPGLTAPSPTGSALMALAGAGWGFYSLRGRGSRSPVTDTARNFLWASPLCVLVSAVWGQAHLSGAGVALALASGALASGVGYAIWYAALAGFSATRAATIQLSVPVLAAVGGLVFLGESLSLRLVIASVVILGGVALAIGRRASR